MKVEETIRRSITINPDLDLRVRDLQAACTRHRIDLDYTKALNMLAELGERWLEDSTPEIREKSKEVLAKYLDYGKFQDSVMEDWVEMEEFRQWKLAKARREKGTR